MINFENLVIGFKAYLESLEKTGEKDYDLESFSDVSIFMYSDEFKDYVSDELNLGSGLESVDLSELLNMDFSNNQFTIPNEEETDIPEEEQNGVQQNFFAGMLNSLFNNGTVKNLLDTDKNSEINEEELNAFLNVLGNFDGSNSSLSLEDMFNGIDSIKNNDFTIPTTETPTVEAPEETPSTSTPFDGSYEYSYSPPQNNDGDTTQEVDLSKLSVDELNTLLSETQTEYLQPQEEYLASILDESETELAGLKEASEELLATYEEKLKEVNVEMAEQLVDIEERLDAKKEEIETNDQAIFEQENTIKDCQTNYDNAVSTTANTPWCAAFVQYVMENSDSAENVPDWYKDIENKWWCPNIASAAKEANAYISSDEAKPGDIVLFDYERDGRMNHVGIVVSNENGKLITIEGNTSNQVAKREYDTNDPRIKYCKMTA